MRRIACLVGAAFLFNFSSAYAAPACKSLKAEITATIASAQKVFHHDPSHLKITGQRATTLFDLISQVHPMGPASTIDRADVFLVAESETNFIMFSKEGCVVTILGTSSEAIEVLLSNLANNAI